MTGPYAARPPPGAVISRPPISGGWREKQSPGPPLARGGHQVRARIGWQEVATAGAWAPDGIPAVVLVGCSGTRPVRPVEVPRRAGNISGTLKRMSIQMVPRKLQVKQIPAHRRACIDLGGTFI